MSKLTQMVSFMEYRKLTSPGEVRNGVKSKLESTERVVKDGESDR